jgi:hypothetical protein
MPPAHHADLVAPREAGRARSQRPDEPRHPLGNMAEKPGQLMQETRTPLPAKPGKPWRDDDEAERVGTANGVLGTEPLTGGRPLALSAQRTAVAWAHQSKHLLADCYPDADKVIVVCANLNPPQLASLSAAFEPQEARRLAPRLAIHYTPKHGSWLHIAESELRVLTQPCLDRRIAEIEMLRQATKAWEHARNAKQTGVDWQLTTDDARMRLKRLYPQYQD